MNPEERLIEINNKLIQINEEQLNLWEERTKLKKIIKYKKGDNK